MVSGMDDRWRPHNLHRTDGIEAFLTQDPTLRRLRERPLVHESSLLDDLAGLPPGIYTIGGGRQVGKTTLVKQLMARLLRTGHEPEALAYVTGELIRDAEDLHAVLQGLATPGDRPHCLIVDEITFVRDWARMVKALADAGALERTVLIITGSDLVVMQDALTQLPGRRGIADEVDFRYLPLDFATFATLRGRLATSIVDTIAAGAIADPLPELTDIELDALEAEFIAYHRCGGYLSAINDLEAHDAIALATLRTYSDWIRGDVLRHGKGDLYLREVLEAILRRATSQITWNALARDLSIDHPRTVADYVGLLERMDVAFVAPALREDRLGPAPKKARKIYLIDPFIHHSIRTFLHGPTEGELAPIVDDEELSRLVEASTIAHARRHGPVYHVKGRGEIDLAYVVDGTIHVVEVKWTRQIRPHTLDEIRRFPNRVVAGRVRGRREIAGTPVIPAPVVLLRLSRST